MLQFRSYKPEIILSLTKLIDQLSVEWNDPLQQLFLSHVLEFSQRGRMVRGSLMIHTWQGFTDQTKSTTSVEDIPSSVFQVAAAIELFESALLLHDDIIDNDDLRRGKPSFHLGVTKSLVEQKDISDHTQKQGESFTMIVADILFFYIYTVFSDLPISESKRIAVIQTFSELAINTGMGQLTDIAAGYQLQQLSKKEILQMYSRKTASYSVCLPLRLGAALAGQSKEMQVKLQTIGTTLGLLYQFADDHKGIFGDPTVTGKLAGGDIREGKQTLHRYIVLEHVTKTVQARFHELYGKTDLSPEEMSEVQRIYSLPEVQNAIKIQQQKWEAETQKHRSELNFPAPITQMLEAVEKVIIDPLSLKIE